MIEVNHKGIDEICEILVARHKSFADTDASNPTVVAAAHEIANDVEFQLSIGNGAMFEIRGHFTYTGNPQEFELSPACINNSGDCLV